MLIHQSDLSSWARCPAALGYAKRGGPHRQTSALAYGSVMHFCIERLERAIAEARRKFPPNKGNYGPEFWDAYASAVQLGLETFAHYWQPTAIEAICPPVDHDGWLRTHNYGYLRERGLNAIRKYAELIRYDDHELLATEFAFVVPIWGTWDVELEEPHLLAGSIDRLAVRYYKRNETLAIDDWKSGQEYRFLRHNIQGTAYSFATTQPEFWLGYDGRFKALPAPEDGFGPERGQELFDRFAGKARRFTWINLRSFKYQDGGFRGPTDYERFKVATQQICDSMQADIYPLAISGEHCTYCPQARICAGVGLPAENHGAPA